MKKIFSLSVIILLFFSLKIEAREVEIEEVLTEIIQNSNAKKSAQHLLNSAEKQAQQYEKHWLPSLYLDSSTYQTNDPTKNFTGNLYQRSVRTSDFDAATINANNSNNFTKSAVGVNLPIYQGGSGLASEAMAKDLSNSWKYNLKQIEVEQYAHATAIYLSLVSLRKQKEQLQKIATTIAEIIKKYSLGNENNPVGYSGALILEASKNKTQIFLTENAEKTKALYQILTELGFKHNSNWNVSDKPLTQYFEKYLRFAEIEKHSFKSSALKAKADAAKNEEQINNAKNLPQINAYAQNYQFSGARAKAIGYSAGINLHWEFYDPLNFNNKSIAQEKTSASRYEFLAQQQNERAEIEYLNSQIKTLEEAVKLANKNDILMFKNVKISKELFKGGNIAASNLSDAIMQYLDNFIYLSNAELQLIELHAKKLTKQQIDIYEILKKAE